MDSKNFKREESEETEKQSPQRPWGQLVRDLVNTAEEFSFCCFNQMFEFPGILRHNDILY